MLKKSKEKIELEVNEKLSKVRITRNWLSKATQCQLYYTQKSKFVQSAEWIIIINQIKTVLNDNDELPKTSDATKPDIIDLETIDDSDQYVANKEADINHGKNISKDYSEKNAIKGY